jgi:hypothetical protein
MAGTKADAAAFSREWAGKGDEKAIVAHLFKLYAETTGK